MNAQKQIVDLRSDTLTKPTTPMRKAMAAAEVGDDVYGEDPTVNRLEEMAAELLGFEAALFVPTGTMGNQVALAVYTRPGMEVVCESDSHIFHYEMAAMAALSGLLPRPVTTDGGIMAANQVADAIQPDIGYLARTGVVSLENSHNRAGGWVMPVERQAEIQAVAREKGVPIHLDGARIFNAAAALGVDAADVAAGFDSVMFCLSKGLGAPVGSMLCGTADFIREARRVRKRFGGGMRQVGVLAAAGIIALAEGALRVGLDHGTAKELAKGLSQVPGLNIPKEPETNILIYEVTPEWFCGNAPEDGDYAGAFVKHIREQGVLALAFDKRRVRMVTHRDLPENAVDRAILAAKS